MKVSFNVDGRAGIRGPQGAMDICVMMEQLSHVTQGGFDGLIAGTSRDNGNGADSRGEFIADPVVQLMQEHVFITKR